MASYYNGEQQPKRPRIEAIDPLVKLLVPNYAAGALIGKGGSVLTELQNKFGGRIRLSASKEFYPGTEERVVVITGQSHQLVDINNHIMEVVTGDTENALHVHDASQDGGREQQVKIVLTNFAAGLLIGKGGETIKAINEASKAKLNLTQRDGGTVPGERVLTMSGSLGSRIEGCRLVIEKIANDESNMRNNNLRYTNGGAGANLNDSYNNQPYSQTQPYSQSHQPYSQSENPMSYGMGGLSKENDKCPLKTTVQVQMEVPDNLVTVLLGKQGQTVRELVQASGARFKFSDKDDFVPGTNNRMLTITGNMNQAQTAYSLVNQKVQNTMGMSMGM